MGATGVRSSGTGGLADWRVPLAIDARTSLSLVEIVGGGGAHLHVVTILLISTIIEYT